MSGYRYPHLRWGLHARAVRYPRHWKVDYTLRPTPPATFHAYRVEPGGRTFGDVLALLAGGLVIGILAWIFVVGLFAVAHS